MKCPVCDTDLRVVDRAGVEIDICPRCKGVWLDRGELDKLIERADREMAQRRYRDDDDDDDDDRRKYDDRRTYDDRRANVPPATNQPQQYPPKKRESFWSNLFDWD